MAELFVTENNEILEGTPESDILDSTGFTGTTLEGLAGNDELLAGTDGTLNGGEGDDLLDATAGGGGNVLNGEAGDDTLFGNSNDTLNGGNGADRLFTTGDGGNTYTGDSGSDQFWLAQSAIPTTPNTVTDFSQGEDVLGIAGLDNVAEGFEDLTIEETEGSTTIAVNEGTTLATLEGVTDELTAEDFTFGTGEDDEPTFNPIEPSSFLDTEFYLDNNPDVANAVDAGVFESGLEHFLNFGLDEARAPSQSLTLFRENSYLNNNSDVKEAVNAEVFESGLDHFLSFGLNQNEVQARIARGGTGYEFYNEEYYVSNNSDVQDALNAGTFNSGLEHFLRIGLDEGRIPSEPLSFFTEDAYLENNNDVQNAIDNGVFDSAIEHFLQFGIKEGLDIRDGTGYEFFGNENYLEENEDVANAIDQGVFGSALEHFVEYGFAENRSGVDIPENSEMVS